MELSSDPFEQAEPFETTHLHAWHAKPEVCKAIVEAVTQGEATALNRLTPARPRTYRGTEAYFESLDNLITHLHPYGFKRDETRNQVRLLAPEDFGPVPMRLLLCRGRSNGGTISVNPKGTLTRILINHQNVLFGPQQNLELFPTQERWLNFWVVSEVSRSILNIYLTLPYWLDGAGTTLTSVDHMTLYSGNLNAVSPSFGDLPEGETIKVTLEEKDGTGG